MNLNSYIKWLATILTIVGAACTSMQLDPYNIILLNSGSIFYLVWSIRIKERSIMMLHIGLLSVYAVGGIYRVLS